MTTRLQPVTLRLSSDQVDELRARADAEDRSVSSVVRLLLRDVFSDADERRPDGGGPVGGSPLAADRAWRELGLE